MHIPKCGGTSISSALLAAHRDSARWLTDGVWENLAFLPEDANIEWASTGLWDPLLSIAEARQILQSLRRVSPLGSIVNFGQKHLPAHILRKFTADDVWDSYFKFAFVRNPWDRVVSTYNFFRAWLRADSILGGQIDRAHLLGRCSGFADFVHLLPLFAIPQSSEFISDEDGETIVDYVGRFENIERDFAGVCETIGISSRLPHLNRSSDSRSYRQRYTPQTREIVARHFARDIETFSYHF